MPVTWCITLSQSPNLPPVNASHMVYHTVTITRPAPVNASHIVYHTVTITRPAPVNASHMVYHTITITRLAPCQCQSHGVSHHHNHQTCPLSMPVTWCITLSQSPDLPPVYANHMVYHTVTITRPATCLCQSHGVSHCHNHQTCPCQCQSHGVSHCHNHQTCPLSMPVTWYVTSSQSPDLPPVNANHMVCHIVIITSPAPINASRNVYLHNHFTYYSSITWQSTITKKKTEVGLSGVW